MYRLFVHVASYTAWCRRYHSCIYGVCCTWDLCSVFFIAYNIWKKIAYSFPLISFSFLFPVLCCVFQFGHHSTQCSALHWLQENVQEFGGDPTSVTLMGHGTGAACATFLMTSPAVLDGKSLKQKFLWTLPPLCSHRQNICRVPLSLLLHCYLWSNIHDNDLYEWRRFRRTRNYCQYSMGTVGEQ